MEPTVINVSEPWFTYLLTGQKTVEGRKGSPKWTHLEVGDGVIFRDASNPTRQFPARIIEITHYVGDDALRDYLVGETLERTLPGVHSLEEGEAIYHQLSRPEEISQ